MKNNFWCKLNKKSVVCLLLLIVLRNSEQKNYSCFACAIYATCSLDSALIWKSSATLVHQQLLIILQSPIHKSLLPIEAHLIFQMLVSSRNKQTVKIPLNIKENIFQEVAIN